MRRDYRSFICRTYITTEYAARLSANRFWASAMFFPKTSLYISYRLQPGYFFFMPSIDIESATNSAKRKITESPRIGIDRDDIVHAQEEVRVLFLEEQLDLLYYLHRDHLLSKVVSSLHYYLSYPVRGEVSVRRLLSEPLLLVLPQQLPRAVAFRLLGSLDVSDELDLLLVGFVRSGPLRNQIFVVRPQLSPHRSLHSLEPLHQVLLEEGYFGFGVVAVRGAVLSLHFLGLLVASRHVDVVVVSSHKQ